MADKSTPDQRKYLKIVSKTSFGGPTDQESTSPGLWSKVKEFLTGEPKYGSVPMTEEQRKKAAATSKAFRGSRDGGAGE